VTHDQLKTPLKYKVLNKSAAVIGSLGHL